MTRDGKLLDFHERKRYYRIRLNYENEEFMMKEYSIGYERIKDKIRKVLVGLLMNHINRVKKRAELRAEIKRVHNTEKEGEGEDEDGMDVEQGSNPEKEGNR